MREATPLLQQHSNEEARALCGELREFLLQSVSQTGGHLSSNLGTVELTVAIHRVFDTSLDRLVFDVGHQCYAHKMITGRKEAFSGLRQFQGIAGFPKPSESIHDAFVAGHASNSIAVAVGMARARDLCQEDYHVLAVLGDGALTGGLAYEGLATGGQVSGQLLVILNDNGMSIAKNVGGFASHLGKQRLKPQYLSFRRFYRATMEKTGLGRRIHRFNHKVKQAVKSSLLPCSFFEQLGFTYYGPVDGHDVEELTKILRHAKELKEPVLLHIRTTKGKDYLPAEESPDAFHGVPPFDPISGMMPSSAGKPSFSRTFGETMVKLGEELPSLCGITAAMATGTGLNIFGNAFPERLFDVGIAEGCGVSMAGGLAKQGAIPVFAVYSTFLQRAYDMIVHDVALEHLHVIFAVDRAGLVGEDGETHHGVLDVAFLSSIPSMTILAPSSLAELTDMLTWAVREQHGMVAIRYPRGNQGRYVANYSQKAVDLLSEGKDITLVSYGTYINQVLDCEERLHEAGFTGEVIKFNQICPLDTAVFLESVRKTKKLVVLEDVVAQGSLGQQLAEAIALEGLTVKIALVNTGDDFVTHGSLDKLEEMLKIDSKGFYKKCLEVLGHGEKRAT